MDKSQVEPMGPGALRRGLHILNALRNALGEPLGVAEIAAAIGLPRPTVYRLLETLEGEGYARRDDSGKLFAISSPDHDLGDRWSAFSHKMEPLMRRIAQRTGNAVFLARQDKAELLVLHREIGTYPIQVLSMPIGGRQPLGVGAAGVALLSMLNSRQLSTILQQNAKTYAAFGNLQASTVQRLVENCQARGYAVAGNYSLKGVLAVGVAIRATGQLPPAAISVTAPLDRMPVARQKEIAQIMHAELKSVM
jgi:DNA-binding IclR family transcriptional regulator